MGLTIVLNTASELCNEVRLLEIPKERRVGDPANALHHYLSPSWRDEKSICLRFIDPYGQVIFNRLQMPAFLKEWEQVKTKASCPEHTELLQRIEILAIRCSQDIGLYLRFIGD